MPRTLDFSSLTSPVTRAEVDAWKTQRKAAGIDPTASDLSVTSRIGGFIGLGVVIVPVGAVLVSKVLDASMGGDAATGGVVAVVVVVAFAIIVALIVWGLIVQSRHKWETWLRLDRFAHANGMTFSPGERDPSYPGVIFQAGRSRRSIDQLTSTSGRLFDLGNYQWVTGSGKNQTTHTWGFLAIKLDRRLPNMMLDATANNSLFGSNLPVTLAKNQRLSLEGDFDRYFTLYCPKEYERDALYVFTPDLMALLIDEAAPYDVEIVDDWMFVYSQEPFPTGNAYTYTRLFRIIDTVGTKTVTQTDRYADERVGDFEANVVAPQGARLKRSVSVFAILFAVVVGGFWLWSVISDSFGN